MDSFAPAARPLVALLKNFFTMNLVRISLPIAASLLLAFSCNQKATAPASPPVDPETLKKIGFDISKIDENGLRGPANGKTTVAYEFCIPSRQVNWEEVQKIDPGLKFANGQGRIGCPKDWWCVLGSTKGGGWRDRLLGIAKLPYIKEIQETVWE